MDGDFRVGPWLVQPNLNTVSRNGAAIRLEPKVMEVLVCLAGHAGEPLPKETLLRAVWPDTFVSEAVLSRCISELRRVFEDDAREPRLIQTIPKRGYRLVAPVEPVNDTQFELRHTETSVSSQNSRIVAMTLSSIALLCGLLIAFDVRGLRERLVGSRMPPIHSIAVLPLKNLSDDPAQKYFAYGMAEELITDLSQMSGLKVISHTSVNRYQDTDKPVPQVARELGVDAVVEGAVQRSGDRVRITAQLIYAPQDSNLWARTYDGDLRDVLALQSTVAREIADEIRVKMTPQETVRLTKARPVLPKALEAYWKGHYHLSLLQRERFVQGREQFARRELRDALANFEEAIQIDPTYAPAYLGYTSAVVEFQYGWDPHTDLTPKRKWALMKALELDDTLAGAHLGLAEDLYAQWNWTGAEKEYKRALELDPNSATAHWCYAGFLYSMGRVQEGLKHHELQVQLDPDLDHTDRFPTLSLNQQIEQMRRFIETHSGAALENYWQLYLLLAKAGRHKEAIDEMESGLTRFGWTESAKALRRGYAQGGYQGALREAAKSLEAKAKHNEYFPPNVLAYLYGVLGDKDRAFAWMEKAYEIHEGSIASMKVNLDYEPLRSDPRFAAMLRQVGLPE